jgi:hypothetical protein
MKRYPLQILCISHMWHNKGHFPRVCFVVYFLYICCVLLIYMLCTSYIYVVYFLYICCVLLIYMLCTSYIYLIWWWSPSHFKGSDICLRQKIIVDAVIGPKYFNRACLAIYISGEGIYFCYSIPFSFINKEFAG